MTDTVHERVPQGMTVVADMSTDFLTKHIDWARYGVVYADASYNIGPAGVTIVVVRHELLGAARADAPVSLRWKTSQSAAPAHAVHMCGLSFDNAIAMGGVSEIESRSKARSQILYSLIDSSDGYYQNSVPPSQRSATSVSFTLKNQLTDKFIYEASERNIIGLKAENSSKDSCRASLYNGMSFEGVFALTNFMQSFKERNP